jgi:hypothetical protein
MSDAADKLTPADPNDLAAALAFALCFQGRERVQTRDYVKLVPPDEKGAAWGDRGPYAQVPPLGWGWCGENASLPRVNNRRNQLRGCNRKGCWPACYITPQF